MEDMSYSIKVVADDFLEDVNKPSFDMTNISCDDVDGLPSDCEVKEVYYA